MGIQELVTSLGDNPYFGAGFGLFGMGAGAAILRKCSQFGMIFFRRHYMTTLEVPCRDKAYHWLLHWITVRGARNTQHLSVETSFQQNETGKIMTKHQFIPSVGEHFFWYKNTWIKVERVRSQQTLDIQMGVPFETVQFTALGRNRDLFFGILDEARSLAMKESEGKLITYTALGSEWRQFGHPRKPRPINSVVLDKGLSKYIVSDVKDFMNNSQWYFDRGIPYRRGYLLHGPPGCGKTSFITALAGELRLGICVLNLSERGLTDDRLNHLMALAPEDTIILLEDVDSAFVSREESDQVKTAYQGLNRLTFSGLLNCLDGVASTEARILFMTTNYPERLDPALIRPGRVDFRQEIGYCTEYQLKTMFTNFFPTSTEEQANSFSQTIIEHNKQVSAAAVQGYFLVFKDSINDAMNNIDLLINLDHVSNNIRKSSEHG